LWIGGVGQRLQHCSIAYVVTSYLLLPFFNGLDCHPLLSQGWTLSFEMYFYLVFACSVLLKLRAARLPFMVATFAILALVGQLLTPESGARNVLDNPILIEFLFGGIAAELVTRLPVLGKHRLARTASIVLISLGVGGLLCTIKLHDAYSSRYLFYGIPAFCIVLGAALLGPVTAPSLLLHLGSCSYSIYITHGFFLWAFVSALKYFALFSFMHGDAAILLGGTATVAISSLTYLMVEKPLTRSLSSIASPKASRRGPDSVLGGATSLLPSRQCSA
jgi:exopolysaccharide production protein ExoZ